MRFLLHTGPIQTARFHHQSNKDNYVVKVMLPTPDLLGHRTNQPARAICLFSTSFRPQDHGPCTSPLFCSIATRVHRAANSNLSSGSIRYDRSTSLHHNDARNPDFQISGCSKSLSHEGSHAYSSQQRTSNQCLAHFSHFFLSLI